MVELLVTPFLLVIPGPPRTPDRRGSAADGRDSRNPSGLFLGLLLYLGFSESAAKGSLYFAIERVDSFGVRGLGLDLLAKTNLGRVANLPAA